MTKSIAFAIALVVLAGCTTVRDKDTLSSEGWPRTHASGGTTSRIFQPQLDSWDGFALKANAAVEIDQAGKQPVFGVARFTARTTVDCDARTVKLDDVKVTDASFPTAPEQQTAFLDSLRQWAASGLRSISLDRLEADLAIMQQRTTVASIPPVDTPPAIVFSLQPAVLVHLYGEPRFAPVRNATLKRVINTRVLLLQDAAGTYYLHLFDGFLQAPNLSGPWTPAAQPPSGADIAEQEARAAGPLDLMEGSKDPRTSQRPRLQDNGLPLIHVATTPTELIAIDGAPIYVPIDGTGLSFVRNTEADVFRHAENDHLYVLISGRWFTAPSLDGPWAFVAGASLPADFRNIPDGSPKAVVKVAVPGTAQAREAAIVNSIPHTAWVDRTIRTTIAIDGPPQIEPIEGTPLSFVVNSEAPIIRVNDNAWYAVRDGVWFGAVSANGPWTTAASVPAVIYSIPPSSPIHYVTFVRVYGVSPQYVYVGYTPGYYGTALGPDGVVVYGTGYDYRPWVGTVLYAPPVTYGVAAVPYYSPATGFAYGFEQRGAIAAYPYYWGPAHHGPHHGSVLEGAYGQWGNSVCPKALTPDVAGDLPYAASRTGNTIYTTSDGKVYRYSGGAWEKQTANGWEGADAEETASLNQQQGFHSSSRNRNTPSMSQLGGGSFGRGMRGFGGGGFGGSSFGAFR